MASNVKPTTILIVEDEVRLLEALPRMVPHGVDCKVEPSP
jgi:hypothetical protein